MEGRSCLTDLIFYNNVTCLVDEEKAVDVVNLEFSKAFDTIAHDILLEKLDAHSLEECTVHWVNIWMDGQAQRVVVNGVKSSRQWSRVVSPQAYCWGQPCLISLSMIFIMGSSAPLVNLQMTSGWVGVICWRAGRLCSGQMGSLDRGQRYEVYQGQVPGPQLGSQQSHPALQAGGRVESCPAEKDLGVLVNSR
ncbi:rna-directed dna polymerase from mobile element jockey-like [Pitangus sulphuratus]|nr:rna-directed dna polymerase from mobile element jockey-like [Pitangus sulphuratus]